MFNASLNHLYLERYSPRYEIGGSLKLTKDSKTTSAVFIQRAPYAYRLSRNILLMRFLILGHAF